MRLTPRHTVVLDWDGTLVPARWPEQPNEWMPGAVEAMKALSEHARLMVFSARTNPYDPWTSRRRPEHEIQGEINYIRSMLDSAGLPQVGIWTREGKPSGFVYVDDRAVFYPGRPGSWPRLVPQILLRLGEEAPMFPAFDQEVAE